MELGEIEDRLSSLDIGVEAEIGGVTVERIAKQRWMIDGKPRGIRKGAKLIKNINAKGEGAVV